MLRSIEDLIKSGVTCPDGDLGRVEQVYFDVRTWGMCYLIVDTSAWGYGEKIWVPLRCISQIDFASGVVKLNRTQQKMLSSSSLDTKTPVSRLQEVRIFDYYDCKPYWEEANFHGTPHDPAAPLEPDANTRMTEQMNALNALNALNATVHPLSTKEVGGFTIEALEGPIGHIRDFVFDDETWLIRYLTVDTRDWWQSESEVLLSTESFKCIDSTTSTISTSLSRDAIKRSPAYIDAVPLSRMYETQLHKP